MAKKEYTVVVTEHLFVCHEIKVKANSEDEACDMAEEKALDIEVAGSDYEHGSWESHVKEV